MPIIPTVPMSRAPEPTESLPCPYPWRFRIGSLVYIVGRPLHDTFTVVGGELWLGWPHLKVYDRDGLTWRVPQIHCSSKPITYRKG
jgi:hypothetical protein